MRWLSRLRRWMDRRRQPYHVWITPDQYRLYTNNSNYRAKRYNGPVHQ